MKKMIFFYLFSTYSYGVSLESTLRSGQSSLTKLSAAVLVLAIIVGGVRYATGDPNAKEQSKNIIVGGFFIFGAVAITDFLKSMFG
jgi:hypothetical protein